ncbi:MAG: 7-cyano-7-deazaguanine synthase [Planctomycetota bacterium]|nr:MAG: 7-cyano-7-deazaguanine synthase [Planctomycetota bacterium]
MALLSGGLDSTVATALAARTAPVVRALTIDYGQRAAARELEAARAIAAALGIPHQVVHLPFLGELGRNALTQHSLEVPRTRPEELEGAQALARAERVWVPNRNGVMLAVAAALAEGLGAGCVIMGFNREEAQTFPDNSYEFLLAARAALRYSTRGRVTLQSPTVGMDKAELLEAGRRAGAPLAHIWVCYLGEEEHCGQCESCQRLVRALERAGARAWWEAERRQVRRLPGVPSAG